MLKKMVAVLLAAVLLFAFAVPAFATSGGGLFSGLKDAANFLRRLIIPDPNYFHNQFADLSRRVNDRFGGLAYLYLMLNDAFETLKQSQTVDIIFKVPNNFMFRGYQGMSINIMQYAKPYTDLLRDVLNVVVCLITAIVCYKKLLTFFHE